MSSSPGRTRRIAPGVEPVRASRWRAARAAGAERASSRCCGPRSCRRGSRSEVPDSLASAGALVAERGPHLVLRPRHRSCPPRPPSRRRAPSRNLPRDPASPAAPSRASRRRPGAALLAHHLPAVQVGAGEQRVVVEHLLEVGHGPGGIDRVAVEAAAELVVDAAVHHRVERRRGQLGRPRSSRNSSVQCGGNFGAPPQPPCARSKASAQRVHCVGDRIRRAALRLLGALHRRARGDRRCGPAPCSRTCSRRLQPGARRSPRAPSPSSASPAAARAGSRCRRRTAYSSGVRNTFSGQPPWPVIAWQAAMQTASMSGRSSRSTFTHTNRSFISLADFRILEGLMRHHMTPVAGRVADRDQQRPVRLARAVAAPQSPHGLPVDRIVSVLQQVGRGLLREPVHRL